MLMKVGCCNHRLTNGAMLQSDDLVVSQVKSDSQNPQQRLCC